MMVNLVTVTISTIDKQISAQKGDDDSKCREVFNWEDDPQSHYAG